MKYRLLIVPACLFVLWVPRAQADVIILKDGREFSGKLVRADANLVEFRTQGKVESFSISEVASITFKEPELVSQGRSRVESAQKSKEEPSPAPVSPRSTQVVGP